jgi:pyridoxine kinase
LGSVFDLWNLNLVLSTNLAPVLDPVMGDGGRFYVPETSLPAYKSLLQDCDLILPNQFELETLSDTKITTTSTLAEAIQKLHSQFRLPHIFVTSTHLVNENSGVSDEEKTISVVGSTARSDGSPRLFRIDVPYYPVYFTGTGDMFAALLVARFREAASQAGLLSRPSWTSPDNVSPSELPLAKATEKVVASMQAILQKTYAAFEAEKKVIEDGEGRSGHGEDEEGPDDRKRLLMTKAVELRVVRNIKDLIEPADVGKYSAKEVEL